MRPSLLDYAVVRSYLARRVLIAVDTPHMRVALTFDDGPNPRHTPDLLDRLAEQRARATFFLVGKRVRRYPGLARRIVADGHEVGCHGMNHIPLPFLTPRLLHGEVEEAGALIEKAAGVRPRWFRPPMGWFMGWSLQMVRRLGYEPVIGNIHPRDSSRPGVDRIVTHVQERVTPGSIIILHDGGWSETVDRSQSVEAARRLIHVLCERGFDLVTLSELVGNQAGVS